MSPLCDATISFFRGATDARPVRTVTIDTIVAAIRTGAYRHPIERLRYLRATRGQAAYNAAKQRLDAVTFGGTFAPTRSKTTLVQHSGLVHGDLDHLNDLQAVKQRLCVDPALAYAFVSPGGDGLKVGVHVEPVEEDASYKHAWQILTDYFHTRYGVTWDPSGKDVCRLCFVSWDPTLYINPDAQLFPVPPVPAAQAPPSSMPPSPRRTVPHDRRDSYARQALDTATRMIDSSTPGNRHFWRRKAAYLLGGYVAGGILTADEARAVLDAAVQRNTAHLQPSLKTIETCLAAGMQEAITLEHLEEERRQWLTTHWHTRARVWTGQLRTVAAEEIPPWH
jgi:hypothetical protein